MKTYLVGGAVRDKLLGYPYHEKDWVVVGATPEQLITLGYQPVGKDFPVFLHPITKEEYALARTERKTAAGHTGFDCYANPSVSLEEDLQRRDLTINAIAQDSDGNLIDPYGGQQDIKDKVLRHVSQAFTEDPLRVLRVARFKARYHQLGFELAAETLQLLQNISASNELLSLPAERIWKELQRSLTEPSPQQFFITLQQAGALKTLLPELGPLAKRTLSTLEQAGRLQQPATVCFAVLVWQCNKDDTDTLCQRLKCPNEFRELAMLVNRLGHQCQHRIHSAQNLLNLLEQLDPFRRPQRFDCFLQCCDLYFDNQQCSSQLRRAFELCESIKVAELTAQGLTGKAIGKELRHRRLAAISRALF